MKQVQKVEVIQYKNNFINQELDVEIMLPDLLENEIYLEALCAILNNQVYCDRKMCIYLENLYAAELDISANRIGYNYALSVNLHFLNYEYLIDGKRIYDNLEKVWIEVIFGIEQYLDGIDMDYVQNFLQSLLDEKLDPEMESFYVLDSYIRKQLNGDKYYEIMQKVIDEISIKNLKEFCFKLYHEAKWMFILCVNKYSKELEKKIEDLRGMTIKNSNILIQTDKVDDLVIKKQKNKTCLEMVYHVKGVKNLISSYIGWLISLIMGGAPFSQVSLQIKERLQLCYYFNVDYDFLTNVIIIQCNVDEDKTDYARSEIEQAILKLKNNAFKFEDLSKIKEFAINIINSFEKSACDIKRWYISQSDYTDKKTINEVNEMIKSISTEDIRELIQQTNKIAISY